MHRDPHAALRRVGAFLTGGALADEDVARAVRETTFEKMREMEASGAGARRWGVRLRPGDPADPDSFKTRRGVVGGWRDYFSLDDEAYATELLSRHDYVRCCRAAGGVGPGQSGARAETVRHAQNPYRAPERAACATKGLSSQAC